jgi:hypothetical protein
MLTDTLHDVHVSAADIIDEVDQSTLASIRERMTRNYFAIGDIAAKYIEAARANGFTAKALSDGTVVQVSQERIEQAIGTYVGRSRRAVRYYYETAVFFPPAIRDEFEVLDFSTFVVARRFKDRWREVLEWAAANLTAPASMVEAQFMGMLQPNVPDNGTVTPAQANGLVSALSRLVEALSGFIKRAPLSPPTARAADNLLDEFRNLLIDIADELDKQGPKN